jgi:hypothetical protein
MIGIRWTAGCKSLCTKRLLADHRLAAVLQDQSLHHRSQVAPIENTLRRIESDAGQKLKHAMTTKAGGLLRPSCPSNRLFAGRRELLSMRSHTRLSLRRI